MLEGCDGAVCRGECNPGSDLAWLSTRRGRDGDGDGDGDVGPVQIRSNWEAPSSMHMAKSAVAKASK